MNHLLEKYNITQPYFIVSNQFYKHKNHIVVYEAIKSLRDEWKDFQVVLTGKEEDYRNPGYITQLKELVKNNELEEHVRTLGVIPRADQLGLMKYSTAVIQPSKFEGWSTVVEDAKSLQKQILLSNIAVHIEQMNENAYYFEPDSSEQLKTLMHSLLKGSILPKPILENYEDRIRLFAHSFISIFKK